MSKELNTQINKRRTFAIISHPDAGKTTLTEKFLLYGGAIKTAGAVKSNKIKKTASSDFMEIERQRGISVATSVMTFEYKNILINLLDTPGHKDFAEDTYRTLTAVDSVILVIDCVKGVETQTEKLMEVCRMRKTPVIIFINKLDRPGRDPFELLDELEEKLNIKTRPLSWPISSGDTFQGVYNLYNSSLKLFKSNKQSIEEDIIEIKEINDVILESHIGEHANHLREDVELIEGVFDDFSEAQYKSGDLAPVFFGSALNNFGVKELLDTFIKIAPQPISRFSEEREIIPEESKLTGFIFKIHANLDPNHRDRVAFLRVCSGTFEKNKYYHHVRLQKKFKFSNPVSFMAQSKQMIEKAFPGDVIGLYDTGNFKIGDGLSEGESVKFKGIPSFSPELFKEVVNKDPMKYKQLEKGIQQLTEEGVAQLFKQRNGNKKFIGTVGELQFEVIQYRLKNEYNASCVFHGLNFFRACWISSKSKSKLDEFCRHKEQYIVLDKQKNLIFLAQSKAVLDITMSNYPDIEFHFTSEFVL